MFRSFTRGRSARPSAVRRCRHNITYPHTICYARIVQPRRCDFGSSPGGAVNTREIHQLGVPATLHRTPRRPCRRFYWEFIAKTAPKYVAMFTSEIPRVANRISGKNLASAPRSICAGRKKKNQTSVRIVAYRLLARSRVFAPIAPPVFRSPEPSFFGRAREGGGVTGENGGDRRDGRRHDLGSGILDTPKRCVWER